MKESGYQTILNSIADGVFTVDDNWQITSWNQAAEKITGYTAAQAIGRRCSEVFRTDICQDACVLRRTMSSGREQINVHVSIATRRGHRKPISVSTAVLRDGADGQPLGGVETFRDLSVIQTLRKRLQERYSFQDIVGKNAKMQELFRLLPDVAQSGSTVLIQGPTGSGKELFASALHQLSRRADNKFVVVNCAALPESLLESELFGYRRGAFTDAKQDKPGRFALAHGGTLVLDEVGELPVRLQAKLLRVLQQRVYEPLGSTAPVAADVRIIAATNRDLREQMAEGHFRDDLFYRLNVIALHIPPLRERRDDIPLLVEHFIERFNAERGGSVEGIGREALAVLMDYDFPGNVRELENIIEHAFVLSKSPLLTLDSLPKDVLPPTVREVTGAMPLVVDDGTLERAEADAIRRALAQFGGHRERTAAKLGIHKTTLIRKMKRLNVRYSNKG